MIPWALSHRKISGHSSVNSLISRLSPEVNVWHLDGGTLSGDPKTVRTDFETISAKHNSLGLNIDFKKCDLGP